MPSDRDIRPTYFLSPDQWEQIVSDYEYGYKNQTQLAHEYGVTPQAISQGLKRHGAVAGCKAMETPKVKALEAKYDRRDELRRQASERRWEHERFKMQVLSEMMEMLEAGVDVDLQKKFIGTCAALVS